MPHLDLLFTVLGETVPIEQAYSLYAGLSRALPTIHSARDIGIFPICGTPGGNGTLLLSRRSVLRMRIPEERIRDLLPLSGKALEIDGHKIRLGVPRVQALVPAATLKADMVLIKIAHASGHSITPELFLAAVRRKLNELGVHGEPAIPLTRGGPHAGQPRRKVLRIKDQTHVGYALIVSGLSASESILLQEQGIGGRRLMGAGLFVAARIG